ncbi:MAG: hypothetical protein ACI8ZM_004782 [Crocinitomix sp.]|jgi:hypothetical protein
MAKNNKSLQKKKSAKSNDKKIEKTIFLENHPNLKKFLITVAVFSPLFIILYSYTFDSKIFVGGDNADYFALGKALSLGEGYTNIHLAGNPPGNHFPPGYPVIMSIYMYLFGYSIIGLKILNGCFLFGTVLLTYFVIKKVSKSKQMAAVTALFLLFNTHFLYYGSIMMSEVPYTFFFMLGVFTLLNVDISKVFYKNWQLLALILVIISLIYIRTIGITLLGGVVCYFLFKRKISYALVTLFSVVILLIPWQIRSANLGGNGYVKSLISVNPYDKSEGTLAFSDLAERLGDNTQRYITKEIPNALFPGIKVEYVNREEGLYHGASASFWVTGLSLILLMIIGIWIRKNKDIHTLLGAIIAFSGIILLLWPQIWYGIRFILPLVPILLYLVLNGGNVIMRWSVLKVFKAKSAPAWTPYILLFGIFMLMPSLKKLNKQANTNFNLSFQHFIDLADWSENLPDSSVVVSRKPNIFYLESGKTSTSFLFSNDSEKQMELLKERKMTHVLLDQLGYSQTSKYLSPFLNNYSGKFKVIKKTPQPVFYLFEFNDELGYTGERVEGKRQGKGTFLWPDGTKYIGQWMDNKRFGYGEYYPIDGSIIKSNWIDNKQDGKGTVLLKDSSIVKAVWHMGIADSLAEYYAKDGTFKGEFFLKPR